ncbi:hypothetical protein [Staphylococcus durrellii]|uniref:hypothetical protein n=1 Tax=Staphylococcus durrellii TaxID=2781773 RepID=UPI0018A10BA7|nr:hypothetical protein [Staphylococcus durrellii]MBF7016992.1 hypothetical protein [Staphylococcus durrellii]
MSIGIIIFAISVIVTIIGAVKDNSHKERQQQTPKKRQEMQQPRGKGFLEKLEETFNELEGQMENKPPGQTTKERNTTNVEPEPVTETRAEKMETTTESMTPDEDGAAQKEKVRERKQDEELQKELEDSVFNDLEDVRNEIDREKEKQLQLMEKRARAIINDKYLSERTKRFRLKQLINANSMHVNDTSDNLRFDKDEVVNGIIWSEILSRPKQI